MMLHNVNEESRYLWLIERTSHVQYEKQLTVSVASLRACSWSGSPVLTVLMDSPSTNTICLFLYLSQESIALCIPYLDLITALTLHNFTDTVE
ncbi:hypothetical protein PBY51_024409 [Eleginops maclovinus]|uniref:Uncharacterized protein n=1 Tax=Eleginops maclovinus TaxID=56733 RepID=A0AAN8AP02_ELEMC|nr:hypothetical protein PBY51_024409 [Eleginops maclovinus]